MLITASNVAVVDTDLTTYLRLTDVDGGDLLAWLGLLGQGVRGQEIDAQVVAARCKAVERQRDPAVRQMLPDCSLQTRHAGFLQKRTRELRSLAERAGEGKINIAVGI